MSQSTTRIGLIGYGQIGRAVHQMIDSNPQTGMQVVFVHDTFKDALKDVPGDLALEDLATFADRSPRSHRRNGAPRCYTPMGQDHPRKNELYVYLGNGTGRPPTRKGHRRNHAALRHARLCATRWCSRHGCTVGKSRRLGIGRRHYEKVAAQCRLRGRRSKSRRDKRTNDSLRWTNSRYLPALPAQCQHARRHRLCRYRL